MSTHRPELRVLTVTILLGTLALALAVVLGYGWWSVQSSGPTFYFNLLLVALLVSVITILLVVLLFSRVHMARRIERVTALVRDIASGNLDRRVPSLFDGEMDGLAQAINEMAASLQAQQEALARQQQALEEANRRLEVLVQEAHHRIKNNLQTVADLLALQATDCPARGGSCLQDSIQRVKSIAAVHELLSVEQSEQTEVRALAERLLRTAIHHTTAPDQRIAGSVEGDALLLASKQATALALVLGELFNNALLHGLAGRRRGGVEVRIHKGAARATLTVRDDGIGLPPDFDWERHERLGLRIVRTLVRRELGGEVDFQSDGGAMATITWPLPTSE